MTAVATPPRAATPAPTEALPVGALRRIALAELHDSPHNPRQRYDETALLELASSFLQTGQLTPIIVRPRKAGGYEIAAGHRRFRAAKLAVQRQPDGAKYRGVDALEAKVVELSDAAFIEVLNVENLQRDDLHPLEEAQGFKDLMTQAGYDVAKIAARVGRSTRYVYDSLTLLKLTPAAKKLFLDGTFERGHAILLARLSPADQARAIGDLEDVAESGEYAAHRASLLLRPDSAADGELPLHDKVKPVSVREFQQAIQEKIRVTPETLDPFLFPDSAQALTAAKEEKLSVIHITREWRPSDEVRDANEKERVFGSQAWERADGKPEEDYHTGRLVKSKTCVWSRYGFVACGPGQGEVFRVCVNKQKCKVHWPEHVKRAEEAKKRAKSGKSVAASGSGGKRESAEEAAERRREQERAREEAERARWKKALPQLRAALAEKVRTAPTGPTSLLGAEVLGHCRGYHWEDGWAKNVMPLGRTADDVVRRAGWLLLTGDLNEHRAMGTGPLFKKFGIDAQAIVDQVAPKPKAETATTDPKQATCPQCGAKPGSPCKRPSGHPVFAGDFHSGRGKNPTGKKAKKGKRS